MARPYFSGFRLALAAAVLLPSLSFGCSAIKRALTRTSSEEVVQESSTSRILGYEETVTLKTTVEEFLAYMSEPNRLAPGGIEVGEQTQSSGEYELPHAGTSMPFNLKRMGLEIKGRMIFLKMDESSMWLVWDNPMVFQSQRWDFKPVKDGLRLILHVGTEIPQQGELAGLEPLMEYVNKEVFKEIDLMLANIQAHFDPSLDPQELVAVGLRGNSYDAFMPVYESWTRVNATPEQVRKWLNNEENSRMMLREFKTDENIMGMALKQEPGTVFHARVDFESGILKYSMDTFFIDESRGRSLLYRDYLLARGQIACIEVSVKPEGLGSNVAIKFFGELPEGSSTDAMNMMIYASGLPDIIRDKVLEIKNGVEGNG